MEKKILVALDGSAYCTNVLHYLERLFAGIQDVFLHLLSVVPCNVSPAGREWLHDEELLNSLSPEARRKHGAMTRYLDQAASRLARCGIPPANITTAVQLLKMGTARDILQTARQGLYDAVVIGRRGISKIEELVIGSVSSSIVEKSRDVPVWVVAGRVQTNKFLVPVDGSFNCLKAIDHLAHVLEGNPNAEVTIFHSSSMLAHEPNVTPKDFYDQWGEEWCEQHLGRPDSLFHAPRQLLIDNGFPAEHIHWQHTFKGIYPSRQILRQSMIDDFGTIVMGRRGVEEKKGIFKGVTDQVLYMAENVAIWIIG